MMGPSLSPLDSLLRVSLSVHFCVATKHGKCARRYYFHMHARTSQSRVALTPEVRPTAQTLDAAMPGRKSLELTDILEQLIRGTLLKTSVTWGPVS